MHYRSEEQLAQMTYESFIEHLAKRYAIKESKVYGIIRWAESRMECMNPTEFSNMKNSAAMCGKYRKTLERHVEDHCARSSLISRWLMKCKKMDVKYAYSRPWGYNDEYITAEARQYAKQYGLTKGTPEYETYLKTYLKTYKKYPYNQDKRLRQLQKQEARNIAIEEAKISSDNAQLRQKGLIPYVLNSCLFWVILILAILVIITILFPEYVLIGIGVIIAFAVFSFLMKWFFGI